MGKDIPRDQGGNYIAGDAHIDVKDSACGGDYVPARIDGRSGIDQGAYEVYKKAQASASALNISPAVVRYKGTKRTFLQCRSKRHVTWNGQRYVFFWGQ